MSQDRALRHYHLVEKALAYIQAHQHQQPNLADVAAHCTMSETHFQKVFTRWAGVSPKQFLQSLTRDACLQRLLCGASILDCSEAAGLSGSSRLHDLMIRLEAVTPGDIKRGGEGLELRYGVHPTHFGYCFLVCTGRGIHQLELLDNSDCDALLVELQQRWPRAQLLADQQATAAIARRVMGSGGDDGAGNDTLTLWLRGSPFQLKVWEALVRVPTGRLCTYSDLAAAIGQPRAARAVGSAVASNPTALLIPCHRVIRKMGVAGEYRWGSLRKQAIIGREGGRSADDSAAVLAGRSAQG